MKRIKVQDVNRLLKQFEEAKKIFDKLKAGQGWSYRIVELKVLDEAKLEGEREDSEPEQDEEFYIPNKNTVSIPADEWRKANMGVPENKINGGWGSTSNEQAWEAAKSEHGMVGKVWLGNPVTKEKKRVEPSLVAGMMAEGWVRAGPRTQL